MTDLNFLDELTKAAGPDTSVTEQAQPVTGTSSPVSVDTSSNGDMSGNSDNAQGDGTDTDKPKYTNIVETREEGNDSDLMTISEFANQLTVKNIQEKNLGADGVVDKSAVYAAMRAVRHPLPVVLVGDGASAVALLPQAAFQAWEERPTRGEGASGGAGGRLSDEDLFKAADVARTKRDALVKRMESLQARMKQAENLYTKRDRQLSERFGTDGWTKVDEWVSVNTPEIADDEKTDSDSE